MYKRANKRSHLHRFAGADASLRRPVGDNVAAVAATAAARRAPRLAALQALELVRLLKRLGMTVGILPPQLRPHLPLLRERFSGDDDTVIIQQATKEAPELLEKASSSSAMWAANAATVAPSVDCADGKLHITPANLFTNLHRRIEAADTRRVLAAIFKNVPNSTVVFPPRTPSAASGRGNERRRCRQPYAAFARSFRQGAACVCL